jgi:hypothetical protein
MAANRWQIGIGVVVLLLMLLVGAFSIGVYVGHHGWTEEGLTYAPGLARARSSRRDEIRPI